MKDVAPHDRPREKLERLGPDGLGDNELLALVLGGGVRGRCLTNCSAQVRRINPGFEPEKDPSQWTLPTPTAP